MASKDAVPYQVTASSVFVFQTLEPKARPSTELLYGEVFLVERLEGQYAYGYAPNGASFGFVRSSALTDDCVQATHIVQARSTSVRPLHGFKTIPQGTLGHGARVRVDQVKNGSAHVADLGWLATSHLRSVDSVTSDWVAEAEKYLGADYVWGGRDGSKGTDCSGLVVSAALTAGLVLPHSAKLIEERCLEKTTRTHARGDLIFWAGHVGIMVDELQMLHATADPAIRAVVIEPLSVVVRRRNKKKEDPLVFRGTLPGLD